MSRLILAAGDPAGRRTGLRAAQTDWSYRRSARRRAPAHPDGLRAAGGRHLARADRGHRRLGTIDGAAEDDVVVIGGTLRVGPTAVVTGRRRRDRRTRRSSIPRRRSLESVDQTADHGTRLGFGIGLGHRRLVAGVRVRRDAAAAGHRAGRRAAAHAGRAAAGSSGIGDARLLGAPRPRPRSAWLGRCCSFRR